jgi:hypothetical protein
VASDGCRHVSCVRTQKTWDSEQVESKAKTLCAEDRTRQSLPDSNTCGVRGSSLQSKSESQSISANSLRRLRESNERVRLLLGHTASRGAYCRDRAEIQLYEQAAECCETLDFEARTGDTDPKGEQQGSPPSAPNEQPVFWASYLTSSSRKLHELRCAPAERCPRVGFSQIYGSASRRAATRGGLRADGPSTATA